MKSESEIERTARKIRFKPDPKINERILHYAKAALERSGKPETVQINVRSLRRFRRLVWAGGIAAAFLIISSWTACFVLSRKVANLREELKKAGHAIVVAPVDETATINLYLREHQNVVARHASLISPTTQQPQMRVNRSDILYYEIYDTEPDYMRPGIIVRGPESQQKIDPNESPAISNGHTLNVSEAREAADFHLISPSWLHPCYKLDEIRKIEGRDTLQLLYTNGVNSVSLFEQPLDGQRGLEAEDFREYVVYCSQGQGGGTILAWRDNALFYVLTGNIEISQLMDLAQLISAANEGRQE